MFTSGSRLIPRPEDLIARPLARGRRLAYIALAVFALADVAALWALGFTPGKYFTQNTKFFAIFLIAAGALSHRYGLSRTGAFLDAISIPGIISLIGGLAIAATAAMTHGFVDDLLSRADQALGFDLPVLIQWVNDRPAIRDLSNTIYLTYAPQLLLLPVALIGFGQRERFHTFCVAWALQFGIGIPIFYLTPAASAFPFYGLPVQNIPGFDPLFPTRTAETIMALQNGTLRDLSKTVGGFITMPSFHASGAVVFAFAGLRMGLLRLPLIALNGLLVGSALTSGSHYLVDIIAGMVMAAICLWAADRIVRRYAQN